MNFRPDIIRPTGPSALADEPDFPLGTLVVLPSRLEIGFDGKREAVQPRVMQVLVALARANGAVVSRDELIRQCWGGQIVGDDAINRSVAKVRALADLAGEPAFDIETVPRVGYRLKQNFPAPERVEITPTEPVSGQIALPHIATTTRTHPLSKRHWFAAGAGLLAIALALTAWLLWPARPKQWTVLRSEILIASSLRASQPAISPDGSMLAYSAGRDIVSRNIYLRRISGGPSFRLTSDGYDDSSPAWSPDGSQIAYIAYQQGRPCRLMIVPAPAGTPHELARCRFAERSHVAWSPSGPILFFLDKRDGKSARRIMRFDLLSGKRIQVSRPPAGALDDAEPVVAPNGRWVAFSRDLDDLHTGLIFIDLKNGAERKLAVVQNTDNIGYAWSADSRSLFAVLHGSGDNAIWAFPVTGQAPDRVSSLPVTVGRLSAGPDGLLAAEFASNNSGLVRAKPRSNNEPEFLAPERSVDHSPDISRDGTIVFAAERPDGAGLYVLSGKTDPRLLISLPGSIGSKIGARWSPDGSRIAYNVVSGKFDGIEIISSGGATLAKVPFQGNSSSPEWAADGHALIFAGLAGNAWRTWRVDIAHPDNVRALPYTGWIDIRLRNNELYGVRIDRPGVWRIDGRPRQITRLPTPDRSWEWRISGNQIFYVDDPLNGHPHVMAQPIEGGQPHIVSTVPGYAWYEDFAVDPKDGSIVYPKVTKLDQEIGLLHLAQR